MNIKNLKLVFVLLTGLLIAFLGYNLRTYRFADFPVIHDTGDEYKFPFNGINLIKKGVPESWSWWSDYGNFPVTQIRGVGYRIVKPYFDDPPLFGLMVGFYSISKGMDTYEKVDAGVLRWPMIKIGALNVFLLFVLVYLVAGFSEAFLSALVYATVPTIVLSSRLVLVENIVITFSLTCLILLLLYLKKSYKFVLPFLFILAGISVLLKQSAIFIPFSIIFLLLSQKKYKFAFIQGLVLVFFSSVWFFYGYHYNWPLFLQLQQINIGREIQLPTMIINLFDTFRIAEKTMNSDGIMIFGAVSIIIYSFLRDPKKSFQNLILPTVAGSYFVFFAIMSAHLKGWYRFPFHPFFSWAIAVLVLELIKNPKFLPTFFFLTVAAFASYITGTGERIMSASQLIKYEFLVPLLMGPLLANEIFDNKIFKRLSQVVIICIIIAFIYFNLKTIYNFQDQFWY